MISIEKNSSRKEKLFFYGWKVTLISSFLLGVTVALTIVSFALIAGIEKQFEHRVQYSHFLTECYAENFTKRDIHQLDGHYKCFEGDKVVKLNYDYLYPNL